MSEVETAFVESGPNQRLIWSLAAKGRFRDLPFPATFEEVKNKIRELSTRFQVRVIATTGRLPYITYDKDGREQIRYMGVAQKVVCENGEIVNEG